MTQEEFNLVSTRSEACKNALNAFQTVVYFRPSDVVATLPEWLAFVASVDTLSQSVDAISPAPAGARIARDLT